eukprot:scaffold1936_cov197-Ochromonas_danica.AAC.2
MTSVLALAYYYFVAAKRQFFSKEEQQKFLKIYVIKANQGRHKKGKYGNNKHNAVAPSAATRPSEQVSSSHHEESTGVRGGGMMGWLGAVPNMFGYLMRAQLNAEMLQSVGPESGLSSPDHVSGGGAMAAGGGKVLPEVPHHPTDTSDYQHQLPSPRQHEVHGHHQAQNGEAGQQGMDQCVDRPVEETHTQHSI